MRLVREQPPGPKGELIGSKALQAAQFQEYSSIDRRQDCIEVAARTTTAGPPREASQQLRRNTRDSIDFSVLFKLYDPILWRESAELRFGNSMGIGTTRRERGCCAGRWGDFIIERANTVQASTLTSH